MTKHQFKERVNLMGGIVNVDRIDSYPISKPFYERTESAVALFLKKPVVGFSINWLNTHFENTEGEKVKKSITKYTRWLNEMRKNNK